MDEFENIAENATRLLLPMANEDTFTEIEMRKCIDEISKVYKTYCDRGLEPRLISHILLEAALGNIVTSDDLSIVANFCHFVRSAGDRACKAINRHWPPPDPNAPLSNWPQGD